MGVPRPPRGDEWLRVAVLRLPRISNSTDIEALACEPGVLVRWVTEPAELAEVDVVVLPGTKATVADLGWLRERGLDRRRSQPMRRGRAGIGHLRWLSDVVPVASLTGSNPAEREVAGLGMLDADIVFAADKVLRRWTAAP